MGWTRRTNSQGLHRSISAQCSSAQAIAREERRHQTPHSGTLRLTFGQGNVRDCGQSIELGKVVEGLTDQPPRHHT